MRHLRRAHPVHWQPLLGLLCSIALGAALGVQADGVDGGSAPAHTASETPSNVHSVTGASSWHPDRFKRHHRSADGCQRVVDSPINALDLWCARLRSRRAPNHFPRRRQCVCAAVSRLAVQSTVPPLNRNFSISEEQIARSVAVSVRARCGARALSCPDNYPRVSSD